jgi:Secretion system C-terminal sorting domain
MKNTTFTEVTLFCLLFLIFWLCPLVSNAQLCPNNGIALAEYNQEDGFFRQSNNDWKAEFLKVYIEPTDPIPAVELQVSSPFFSSVPYNPNLFDLPTFPSPKDNEPIDGWVMLYKQLGIYQSPVSHPIFILYNTYTGKVRTFILVKKTDEFTYDASSFLIEHLDADIDGQLKSSSLFSMQNPLINANDQFNKELVSNALNTPESNGFIWLFNAFVANYDPCTCVYNSAINVKVTTTNVQQIAELSAGTEVATYNYITESGTSSNFNLGKDLFGSTGLISSGNKYYKSLTEFGAAINKPLLQDILINQTDNVKNVAMTGIKYGPYLGFAIAAVEFAVGGGQETKPEPKLTGFQSSFSYSTNGTLSDDNNLTNYLFSTPGSSLTPIVTENLRPLYDNPLGIFGMATTPVLTYGIFTTKPCDETSTLPPGLPISYPTQICEMGVTTFPIPNMAYSSTEFFRVSTVMKLKQIDYAINPASKLSVNELKAALFFEPGKGDPSFFNLVADEGKWRTPYMSIGALENYTINTQFYLTNVGGFETSLNNALASSEFGLYCCQYPDQTWFFPQNAALHVVAEFQTPLSCASKGVCTQKTQNIFYSARFNTKVALDDKLTNFNYLAGASNYDLEYPFNNPMKLISQNLRIPSNTSASFLLNVTNDLNYVTYNEALVNFDQINFNGHTIHIHATAVYFQGSDIPSILIPYLEASGLFRLPLGAQPSYDANGYLDGYYIESQITGSDPLTGLAYIGFSFDFIPLSIPNIKLDLEYRNFTNRLPMKSTAISYHCTSQYFPDFPTKMLEESQEFTDEAFILEKSDFIIYPNPTIENDLITLFWQNDLPNIKETKFQIFDQLGRSVKDLENVETKLGENKILTDVSSLANGVYSIVKTDALSTKVVSFFKR